MKKIKSIINHEIFEIILNTGNHKKLLGVTFGKEKEGKEKEKEVKNNPGMYSLLMRLDLNVDIFIRQLGLFNFLPGYYVYTGSALNGLNARISRHKRPRKKLHWHIDYFLKRAKIIKIFTYRTNQKLECKLNKRVQKLPNARILVKGFGSSDCRCSSHLTFFGDFNPMNSMSKINIQNL